MCPTFYVIDTSLAMTLNWIHMRKWMNGYYENVLLVRI